MRAVYGLYDDGHAAQRAVNGLRAAGVGDAEITVITAQPMEEFEFSHIGRETWMWSIATGGALLGLAFATWLAWFIERDWPLKAERQALRRRRVRVWKRRSAQQRQLGNHRRKSSVGACVQE